MFEDGRYRRNPDVSWRTIEGQVVLIHNRLGEIMVLNEVGSYAWQHFEDGLEALVGNIAHEYEVPPETARADLNAFMEELIQAGGLVPSPGS